MRELGNQLRSAPCRAFLSPALLFLFPPLYPSIPLLLRRGHGQLKIIYFFLIKVFSIFFPFLKFLFYLFLAVLGPRWCTRAFSSCGEQGLLFVAVHGLLIAVASLVAEHRL